MTALMFGRKGRTKEKRKRPTPVQWRKPGLAAGLHGLPAAASGQCSDFGLDWRPIKSGPPAIRIPPLGPLRCGISWLAPSQGSQPLPSERPYPDYSVLRKEVDTMTGTFVPPPCSHHHPPSSSWPPPVRSLCPRHPPSAVRRGSAGALFSARPRNQQTRASGSGRRRSEAAAGCAPRR